MYIDSKRPVVFLDIDGVLNGGWQHENYFEINVKEILSRNGRGDYVLKSKTLSLFGLFKKYEVQVIIVSSWCRPDQFSHHEEIQEMQVFFDYKDILGSLCTGGGVERVKSIMSFIEALPDIKTYLAIDDSYHWYREAGFPLEHLIACNGRYGIADCQLSEIQDYFITGERLRSLYKDTMNWNPFNDTP